MKDKPKISAEEIKKKYEAKRKAIKKETIIRKK